MENEILSRNKNLNRGFRKLEIRQIAVDIYQFIYSILKANNSIPFKIKAQIQDASLSISSNIAEGYTRRTLKENLRFNEISLGSAAENYSQMYCLFITKLITDEEFKSFDELLYKFENKTIAMNKNLINKINTGFDWKNEY